jgi:hypothetical protein
MAADLTITTIRPVMVLEQYTGPVNEAVALGQYVRINTTTGLVELGNGSSAAEARAGGLALHAAAVGETVTFVRKGVVDVGEALVNLTYDDDVFLSNTDGTLADTAGTATLIVGTVFPGWASTTADKLLRLDL